MTSYMLKLKALKTVDQGMAFQHVLRAPPEVELMTEAVEVLVIPVMKRRGGVMLAVPTGFFANPVLEAGFAAVQTELIGPSTTLTVPAVLEEEDGTETALGSDVEVVVIDFALAILDHVRLFDPVTEGPEIHCFYPGSPEIYPSPQLLLEAVTSWIQTASEDRVGFYTAMEEEQVAKASPKASVPAAKKGPRKVTNAVLAEQVSALADTLPVVLEQLGALQSSQEKLEGLVAQGQHQAKVPPYRQPFPQALPKFPPTAAAKFLGEIGPLLESKQWVLRHLQVFSKARSSLETSPASFLAKKAIKSNWKLRRRPLEKPVCNAFYCSSPKLLPHWWLTCHLKMGWEIWAELAREQLSH